MSRVSSVFPFALVLCSLSLIFVLLREQEWGSTLDEDEVAPATFTALSKTIYVPGHSFLLRRDGLPLDEVPEGLCGRLQDTAEGETLEARLLHLDLSVHVMVGGHDGASDLQDLLSSLFQACYPVGAGSAWKLDIHYWLESVYDTSITDFLAGFTWPYGATYLHGLEESAELSQVFWRHPLPSQVRVVVSESMVLASTFLYSLTPTLWAILEEESTIDVVGVSLISTQTVRLDRREEFYVGKLPFTLLGTALVGKRWDTVRDSGAVLRSDHLWRCKSHEEEQDYLEFKAPGEPSLAYTKPSGCSLGSWQSRDGRCPYMSSSPPCHQHEAFGGEAPRNEKSVAAPRHDGNRSSCWSQKEWLSEARFLLYQPQFGMGNQIRALEAGLAVATLLGRVLVVPHFISGNGLGALLPFDSIVDLSWLTSERIIISVQDFLMLLDTCAAHTSQTLFPRRVLHVHLPVQQLQPSNEYFRALFGFENDSLVDFPMEDTTSSGWKRAALAMSDQTVAFTGMFGMFGGFSGKRGLRKDRERHKEMVAHIYQESPRISAMVHALFQARILKFGGRRRPESASEVAARPPYVCAHLRRGDFAKSCLLYKEEYLAGAARPWVQALFRKKRACWVDEELFSSNLAPLVPIKRRGLTPDFVYVSTDDSEFVRAQAHLFEIPLLTLNDFLQSGHPSRLDSDVNDSSGLLPMVDATICSRATHIVTNQFSTFSKFVQDKALRGTLLEGSPAPPVISSWTHA